MPQVTLIRAAWVAPMDRAPIRSGGVVFQGDRIIAVGEADALASEYRNAAIVDRRDSTVLPGLVNAHTHLELTGLPRPPAAGNFTDWLLGLVPAAQGSAESVRQSVERSVPLGVRQCLRFGVTTVGDITRNAGLTRPFLRD